jgi:hypothetical protein
MVFAAVANDAEVAVDAFPDNVAVIVPALKFPEESRATTFETVFVDVASTANVLAVDPLNVPPEVKYVPAVRAAVVAFAVVAVVAVVALVALPAKLVTVNVLVVALKVNVELSTLDALLPVVPSANIK